MVDQPREAEIAPPVPGEDVARPFPPGFLFGTATATFQNEANKLDDEYRRNSDWDVLYSRKEYSYLNHSSPDWWSNDNREAEADLATLRGLGLNAQRHGVEWARIEPEKGRVSTGAIKRYRKLFDYMMELGITPVLTLHHFSCPAWWSGFETRSGTKEFEDFVRRMADAFGDVRHWATFAEPNSYLAAAYLLGLRPPYRKNYRAFAAAAHNLAKAHETAYGILKQNADNVSVGAAHSIFWVNAHDPSSSADRAMAGAARFVTTYLSPRLLRPCDFIGVNFFYGMEARFNPRGKFWKSEMYPDAEALNMPRRLPFGAELVRPKGLVSNSGWPVTPDLFLEALEAVHRKFGKPIMVTSNGISDRTDAIRPYYLLSHLVAIVEAIARGVDIRGYFHWTAVTNREWEDGMTGRTDFGLIGVDPETGAREIRPSAGMFGQIAAAGQIDAGRFARYLTPEQQLELEAFDSRIRSARQSVAGG